MSNEEFTGWLTDEVDARRMLPSQRKDLLDQKKLFEAQRELIQLEYSGQVVGFAAGVQFVANELHDLLRDAKSGYPGRMLYFEPVGFDLF